MSSERLPTFRFVARGVAAAAFCLLLPAAGGAESEPDPYTLTAAQWIDRVDAALLPGASMVATARIDTRDGLGGESIDVIEWVRAQFGDTERTLIEVIAPEAGKGAAYEIVAEPGEPLERWAWIPEVRRLRKIVGVRRTDPFLGTEFNYEDLALAVPEERRAGEVRWVREGDDRSVELESPPYHDYGRVVMRVDPATALPKTVHFYDRAGQLFREQHFEEVRAIEGRPFPMRIIARDHLTGAQSVLTFDSVRFDVEVPLERFAKSEVRRRVTRATRPPPETTAAPSPE